MRKIKLIYILLFFILYSCQNSELNNPFDPEYPKEIWTPSNFTANQQGNTINLSWVGDVKDITNFRIERKIEGEISWTVMVWVPNTTIAWSDSIITGGKFYEYRLVAVAGTNESNFVTVQILPLLMARLTTASPSTITASSVILGGTVTTDGGTPITERGICWATNTNPTTDNNKLALGFGTGDFSHTINDLTANTTYYVRAYASNSQGTVYGNELNFKTGPVGTIADIDGNIYHTIVIGTQSWMVENLKTTKYNDGVAIPKVTDRNSWLTNTTGAFCWYNNDSASYNEDYGVLYNWYTVKTNKLAPIGWRVPSDADWAILINYLGGKTIAGGKLKKNDLLFWANPNTGATNISGFFGLPGGDRGYNGGFYTINYIGFWWSSTGTSSDLIARLLFLDYSSENANIAVDENDYGFSVRCIKN